MFIIFPATALYFLSGLTFLLPADSGEKVSFAVTLLLAQFLSFVTLSEIFPASSLNFPKLAYFVAVVTSHMSFNCLLSIIAVNVRVEWSQSKMNKYLKRFLSSNIMFLFFLAPIESRSNSSLKRSDLNPAEIEAKGLNENSILDENVSRSDINVENPEDDEQHWKKFVTFMDRNFLLLHFLIVAVVASRFNYEFNNVD
ncbi:acetylcholine receptor subunit alpha-type unc-63-like [Convolutriloba macropyga]|uniref:acetylcholine receptor subunit alpha-type unc-63-like n=1 Tax=Convolutriloba macropyga TaxID=536237 RepID=UPI003F525C76